MRSNALLALAPACYTIEDLPAKLAANMTTDGDCWIWGGAHNGDGYGHVRWHGKVVQTHWLAYTEITGNAVPPGRELDHVVALGCRSRACMNPAHMEPVTHKINVLRGNSPAAINARKVRCIRNHVFSSVRPNGYRRCGECELLRYERRHGRRPKMAA